MPVVPLSKAAVDANQTERRATELLNQWLKSYFDGAAHTVGDFIGQVFPLCEIVFNQAAPGGGKPLLHVVYASLRPARDFVRRATVAGGEDRKQMTVATVLNIFVRVKNAGEAVIGAEATCREIADLLKMILEHPEARGALAQKGVHHAKVLAGPAAQPFPGMQVRLLTVAAQLRYRI
jgi:hypothetical protein